MGGRDALRQAELVAHGGELPLARLGAHEGELLALLVGGVAFDVQAEQLQRFVEARVGGAHLLEVGQGLLGLGLLGDAGFHDGVTAEATSSGVEHLLLGGLVHGEGTDQALEELRTLLGPGLLDLVEEASHLLVLGLQEGDHIKVVGLLCGGHGGSPSGRVCTRLYPAVEMSGLVSVPRTGGSSALDTRKVAVVEHVRQALQQRGADGWQAMNQPGLAVEVVRLGSRAEVRLAGEIDVATAPTLRDAIHQVVDAGVERIVVDLAAVTFLDSFAINAIEEVRLRADVQPDRIVVVNPSPLAARIFEIVGLAELVRREPPEAGASDCVGRAQQ